MPISLSRAAAVAAIGTLALVVQPVMAKPAADKSNGAQVSINDHTCTGAVPSEDGLIVAEGIFTGAEHKVQKVKTGSGNMFLMCKFDVPASLVPDSRRSAKGFGCVVDDGVRTTDTQMLVSPGGRGMLLCQVN